MSVRESKAEKIFLDTVERHEPDQWSAVVLEACGDDLEVRNRVEALLKAHQRSHRLLEAGGVLASLDVSSIAEGPGTQVGRYKLLEQIGEGGFGVVFMAQQIDPVRRKVALKIIKPGMDTKEVVARFEAERQALAMMDHPNVAKVLDGGATESGRPYFVMELVNGVSITEYCDKRRLSTQRRLELFIDVCHAVQHAHQKGIIHRDIKPSNIMITLYDGRPTVKVIDFGVSKAIQQQLTEKTLFTRYGQMVGTPQYMSPEQAEMSGLDIDTRSDIYSLGVLLYELLIGSTPLTAERLRIVAYADIQRLIRDEESDRPSTRLSTTARQQLVDIAENRDTSPGELRRQIRGDLDWIVMKSLEKDRSRRYGTAIEFATDIHKYLVGGVVEACPPSLAYRLRKAAHRNKVLLATGGAIALALLVATIVSTLFAVFAYRAADEKETARLAERKLRNVADAQADSMRRQLYGLLIGRAMEAHNEHNLRIMREALDRCPDDLRDWEWSRLDWLSQPTEHVAIAGQEVPTFIDHDKRLVAVGSDRKSIQVWDTDTGEVLKTLNMSKTFAPGSEPITMNAVHPNQRLVVAGGEFGTLAMADLKTGERIWAIDGHSGRVDGLAFSPDGTRIASVSWDGTLKMWNAISGGLLWGSVPVNHKLRGVTFSPSGEQIVTAGSYYAEENDVPARVWDAGSGKLLHILPHGHAASCATYSPDGRHIVTGSIDGTLRFWDAETGHEVRRLFGARARVHSVAFSPDGEHIASGCSDHTVSVFDTTTGEVLQTFRGHDDFVFWLQFSSDGRRIASFSPHETCIWSVTRSPDTLILNGREGLMANIVFSPAGDRVAAAGTGRAVHIWDVATGRELRALYGHGSMILGLAWRPGRDQLASCDWDGFVRIWDATTGLAKHVVRPCDRRMIAFHSLAYSPDGSQLACLGRKGAFLVLNADTGQVLAAPQANETEASSVAFSGDGRWIASSSVDGTTTIWEAETFQSVAALNSHDDCVTRVRFLPDSERVVSGSEDGSVSIWDWRQRTESHAIGEHLRPVFDIVTLPNGKRIISADAGGWIKVFDVQEGREIMAWQDGAGWLFGLAVSAEGGVIASAGLGSTVRLWETRPPVDSSPWPRHFVESVSRRVDERFERLVFAEEVIASFQSEEDTEPSAVDLAVQLARARGDDPYRLNKDSWNVVRRDDCGESEYRDALSRAEAACRVVSDCSEYQCTRALALYRVGRFEEAMTAFQLAYDLRRQLGLENHANIAIGMVLTYCRLDQMHEASRELIAAEKLLERIDRGPGPKEWYGDFQADTLFSQAQALITSSVARQPDSDN